MQFPVLGAYFITFNRAQGQTLKQCGLHLPQSVFTHGQLYVGLSRCGDPNNIFVFASQEEMQELRDKGLLPQQGDYTRNVVLHRSIKFIN
jgi:hypothetical protein